MRWRSPREIAFRLSQETRNLALFARPWALPDDAGQASAPFPDPEAAVQALRGTPAAEAITTWAGQILRHRFPLLGMEIETGPEIHWRRDYVSGKETPPAYFRTIPYLDPARAGDHKPIWELNRHQHLVLLAQACLLTGRGEFLSEIQHQLDSWFQANPFQRGINWASALEVALRSLSWMWVDHLVGGRMQAESRQRLREGLYRHALHLEANLSVYFSPNTHLLGEAVALHALGLMFRGIARAEAWERRGAQVVAGEMERQVRTDGSHFEQSSYYHVYALDMFLSHAVLARPSQSYREKLGRMAQYLAALMGPSRSLPFLGDDDGGRFFHPFGPRHRFGRATLAACGCFLNHPEWIGEQEDLHEYATWWLGPHTGAGRARPAVGESRWFADAGVAVMRAGAAHCIVDAGSLGPFRAGHGHADALSIVARAGGQDLLIDPGTFSYSDAHWRDVFRGTAAHNTVRLNQLDQADPAGSFGWRNLPEVTLREWHTDESADFMDAECRARGFRHRRRVFFVKPEFLFVLDDIEGGQIGAEQFWHPGGPVEMLTPACFRIAGAGTLVLALTSAELSEGGEFGWRSPALGSKRPAPLIVGRRTGAQAVRFGAVLAFSAPAAPSALAIVNAGEDIRLTLTGAWQASVTFPAAGPPRLETL
jgi:heparinase II/III-like protein